MSTLKVRALWLGLAPLVLLAPLRAYGADTTPERTLVYNFSWSMDQVVSAGGTDSESTSVNWSTAPMDMRYYGNAVNSKGTITAEIMGTQPDGGVIVSIVMEGQNVPAMSPATCVAYGNTAVICDPNKSVYGAEFTLLRFLGSNFVDPNRLDASKHWRLSHDYGDRVEQADYTIGGSSGSTIQIGETRKVEETTGRKSTSNVDTKIGYDVSRSVPVSVQEYVTTRGDNGDAGFSKSTYQTTLDLASDTMAKAP
ncbi:MAG TPA: hypothetical protein VKR56_04850 [Candidatus Cybelea sp.]|nr:hypothetical protein [Candidatus Cybelea sp.]